MALMANDIFEDVSCYVWVNKCIDSILILIEIVFEFLFPIQLIIEFPF